MCADLTTSPTKTPFIVVSNRLPFRVERRGRQLHVLPSPGGLVTAMRPALSRHGGTWIGWPGISSEDIADVKSGLSLPEEGDGVRYRAVDLSAHEVAQYYSGFSNGTLWPLFHYFVSRMRIDSQAWKVYERVNERFAEITAQEMRGDELVWIHDYQLLRMARHLRLRKPHARIALFLHIPFPASDVFRVLPWDRHLLVGMLSADLVGFHIRAYAEHFLTCAQRLLGCEIDANEGVVLFEGRAVAVQVHPISIDVSEFEGLARAADAARVPPHNDRPVEVLGVDRLDYTKGIHERLLAIERFFERFAEYRGRVVFTQLMVPSRERVFEYAAMKREIDETVGRINGRFSEPGWAPIRYLFRSLPADELVALYLQADVALVTPLRDGMNLVAKEFVTAQIDNDAVLILSEMAGAAEELQEALIVNPFDLDAVAEAIRTAVTMPADERRARMSALRERVRRSDVHVWVERFLSAAEIAAAKARSGSVAPADRLRRRLGPWLAQRERLSLFLDYDGTLAPIALRPEDATLSESARQALAGAARAAHLDVTVVSGRGLHDLKAMVGLEGIAYVGNHGFEMEGPGLTFSQPDADAFRPALASAAHALERANVKGALVEHKGLGLSFHYRLVPLDRQAEVRARAERLMKKRFGLRVTHGNCVVEGRPDVDWHKGRAVLHLLLSRYGLEWPARCRAVYVGDDLTDEDAFRSLAGIGRSIRVGPAHNGHEQSADFMLPDPDSVVQFVRWLAAGAYLAAKP